MSRHTIELCECGPRDGQRVTVPAAVIGAAVYRMPKPATDLADEYRWNGSRTYDNVPRFERQPLRAE